MSNINEPNGFNYDALNAKAVYGIRTPNNEDAQQANSFLNAKMVYGICTPKEDVVDIKNQPEKKISFCGRCKNAISKLFKKGQ